MGLFGSEVPEKEKTAGLSPGGLSLAAIAIG